LSCKSFGKVIEVLNSTNYVEVAHFFVEMSFELNLIKSNQVDSNIIESVDKKYKLYLEQLKSKERGEDDN
jgi:plastocyanin domain-containing protein